MRAYEFLNESTGKPHDHHSTVQKGFAKVRDPGGYNPTYHLNRLMMATAMSDGKDPSSIKMDHESWIGPFNSVHPYTEEEYNMYISATKTIPTDKKDVVPYSKSKEPEDTNKKSLVIANKGILGK